MSWKPALSLFLTTLRLKLLEDSSLDTEVEVGPGKDSDATDGKGERVPILSLANALGPPAFPRVSGSPVVP